MAQPTNLISKVPYGTFLNFSPRGASEKSQKSKEICYKFKQGKPDVLNALIADFKANLQQYPFADFFGEDVTLIPTPGSAPLYKGALWPSKMIADNLVTGGFAKEALPCIERIKAVQKSATASAGNRPDVQTHYDSLAVKKSLIVPEKILIVDDVLTRGCTTLAVASRVKEAYPEADIKIFAPIRTQGLVQDITLLKDPSVGTVSLVNGQCQRDP